MGFMDGYKTYDDSKGRGSPNKWRASFKQRLTGEEAQAIIDEGDQTPWQILGVPKGVALTEIKKSYRKLVMRWHPDKNNGSEESVAMFKKIDAAYTILNPDRK